MADPISAGIALAATGLQVAGTISQGQSAAQGQEYRAQQAANAAEIGRTQAAQTDAYMRDQLGAQLANISAVRASAGTSPDSPTEGAIISRQQTLGDQAREQKVANIRNQASSDQAASAFYARSASNAITGSYLGAAGQLFSGLGGAYRSGGVAGGGGNYMAGAAFDPNGNGGIY